MISIIVPVYNAERWLRRCVDSILAQTHTDFELMLVDDGSTDASGAICDEYGSRDSRVRVFHKPNGGVSSARNLGLDNARGEWISFVDSDDEIRNINTFTEAGSNVDMLLMTLRVIDWSGREYCEAIRLQSGLSETKGNYIKYFLHYHIFNSVCGKVYRKSTIENLRFESDIKFGEDAIFNLRAMAAVRQIAVLDEAEYIYYREQDYGVKYQSPIDESISTLWRIFSAYWLLQTRNRDFERNVFDCYRSICYGEWIENPSLWKDNELVKSVYCRIKDAYPVEFRFKYKLASSRIYTLYRRLKVPKRPTKVQY